MKPWRKDDSRSSSSLMQHKNDHSQDHSVKPHDEDKREYIHHNHDDRHHKSYRDARGSDYHYDDRHAERHNKDSRGSDYHYHDRSAERQNKDSWDEKESNRSKHRSGSSGKIYRGKSREYSPRTVSEKEAHQSHTNQRDRYKKHFNSKVAL